MKEVPTLAFELLPCMERSSEAVVWPDGCVCPTAATRSAARGPRPAACR